MKLLPLAAALLLPLSASAKNHDFQNELSFHYIKGTTANADVKSPILGFAHYFEPVSTADGPYKEAPFLQRVGAISILAGNAHYKFENTLNMSGPMFGLAVTAILDPLPVVISADYLKISTDSETDSISRYPQYRSSNIDQEVKIGSYIGQNTLVLIGYGQEYMELEEKEPDLRDLERETNRYISLYIKHLAILDQERFLRIEPSFTQTKKGDKSELDVDIELGLYLNRSAQIMATLARNFETNLTEATIGFEYFVTTHSSFSISYTDSLVDTSDDENSNTTLSVNMRF